MIEFLKDPPLTLILLVGGSLFVVLLIWRLGSQKYEKPYQELGSHFVEIPDFRIHYLQAGEGPDLVLLHGIGASTYCWRLLITPLSRFFKVTCLDLPGFGYSSKPTNVRYDLDSQAERISQALRKLNIHEAHLVGCSMGGLLALWMARAHPEQFKKVVALAPAADPRLVILPWSSMTTFSSAARLVMTRKVMEGILRRVLHNRDLVTAEVIEAYLYPYKADKNTMKTFVAATDTLSDPRLPHALKEVKAKTLLLYGLQDKIVPKKSILPLVELLPKVHYEEIDGGHHLMEDQPEWTLEQILKFL